MTTVDVESVTDEIRRACRPGDITPATTEVIVKRIDGQFYAVLAADDLIAGRLAPEGLTLAEHAERWSALYLIARVPVG